MHLALPALLHLALTLGPSVAAANGTCVVVVERDALGRVVREQQGSDPVESEYGPLGLRSRMKTSRGHVLEIERNIVGDVLALRTSGGPAVAPGSDAKQDAAPAWEVRQIAGHRGAQWT